MTSTGAVGEEAVRRGNGRWKRAVVAMLRRVEPWLLAAPHDPLVVTAVARTRLATNLTRMRLVLPVLAVLHWLIAALLGSAQLPATADSLAIVAAWRRDLETAHLVMGVLAAGLAALAWLASRAEPRSLPGWRRVLPATAALAYLELAAWITGIDQRIAAGITAFMVASFGVALILRLPARAAVPLYALAAVTVAAALLVYQPNASLRSSAIINTTLVAVLGALLSSLLDRAFVSDAVNRRTIEAQQRELVATNSELSRSLGLLHEVNARIEREVRAHAEAERELHRLAVEDPLTEVANRRHFLALVERRTDRRGPPAAGLWLAMVDVDHFKAINDTHGHAAGDEVLRAVARSCAEVVRESDLVGRLGGDEFALVFPSASESDARGVADRLRAAISTVPVPTRAGPLAVTVSVGVTEIPTGDDAVGRALQRADEALYEAKHAGRNRVHPSPPVTAE